MRWPRGRSGGRWEAAALLRLLPVRPRVLALGEPTHGEETLLGLRNVLFRQLVEQEGYRAIAVESCCLKGLVVDDYVTFGTGTLDDVMARGFSHGLGGSAANRDLVRWMRRHNEGRDVGERVRFAGMDGPLEITHAESPRRALTALHCYLANLVEAEPLPCDAAVLDELLGDDERWTEPEAMMNPERSIGGSADVRQLRLLADDLVALLDTVPAGGGGDGERARLYARTAVGLLRYHQAMADPSPARMTRLCALRDAMMAGHLLTVRGPLLAHAHNSHLQRAKSSMRMWQGRVEWWGAGALASAQLGAEYGFVATALGTMTHHGVDTPAPDTLEGLLHTHPKESFLINSPSLPRDLPPRVSPYHGYAPLDPAQLPGIDGLMYVKDVPRR